MALCVLRVFMRMTHVQYKHQEPGNIFGLKNLYVVEIYLQLSWISNETLVNSVVIIMKIFVSFTVNIKCS